MSSTALAPCLPSSCATDAVAASLLDEAVILRWSSGDEDCYGVPAKSYSPDPSICVGFRWRRGWDGLDGSQANTQAPNMLAELSVPTGTIVDNRDRVQVTRVWPNTLANPLLFEVDGPALPGTFVDKVNLKLVNDNC